MLTDRNGEGWRQGLGPRRLDGAGLSRLGWKEQKTRRRQSHPATQVTWSLGWVFLGRIFPQPSISSAPVLGPAIVYRTSWSGYSRTLFGDPFSYGTGVAHLKRTSGLTGQRECKIPPAEQPWASSQVEYQDFIQSRRRGEIYRGRLPLRLLRHTSALHSSPPHRLLQTPGSGCTLTGREGATGRV